MRLLRQRFADVLVIIGVHAPKFFTEGDIDSVRQALMRHQIDHPVVSDVDFAIWESYTVKAWPTVALIDPQGKLVDTQSGEILADDFVPKIEALIAEFEPRGLLNRTPLTLAPERIAQETRMLSYPSKLLLAQPQTSSERFLFVADTGHHQILQLTLTANNRRGSVARVFGSGQSGLADGSAVEAMFHGPRGMALRNQTLYVADTDNHAIRAINLADGAVRTVAGTGHKAHGRIQFGPPLQTPLRSPWALLAAEQYLFIAMAGSHQVWVMVDEAEIGPFFGNGREALVDGKAIEASFNQPSDLALGLNHLFIADAEASAIRAIDMTANPPQVLTLVGQGLFAFGDVDGSGDEVRLQHPIGLAFDEATGLIFIVDSYNHKIKTLNPTTGEVNTLIGTGEAGLVDGPFAAAQLFEPEGVVAADGLLFIADTNNHRLRVADFAAETIHTLVVEGD